MKNVDLIKASDFVNLFMGLATILVCAPQGYSQDKGENSSLNDRRFHHEVPDGSYIRSPRKAHAVSPAYNYYSSGFSVVQVNVDANGNNIVKDAANEPSIAFNPLNPDQMAIGWRQFDTISNNFRQAGNAFTNDAGQTWTFPGVIDPGVFRSDPVLGYDSEGNLYYNSLTANEFDEYWTNVYKSSDGGETWEMGTFAQGGDKQWMSIDRSGGIGEGNIYEFWNGYYSICTPDNFTRSTDGNQSYEICTTIPGDPYWGTTVVGPDGALYMCGRLWGAGFMVARSSTAQNPGQQVSWDLTVGVDLGGEGSQNPGNNSPNPGGLLGQAIITLDSTGGPGHGNIYMLCSVERSTNSDPRDVMFSRSTDGGWNWSAPVRVNDDFGMSDFQWFGTMSVAPDGRIDVIWLDTRDNPGFYNSALYYSYSLDQGVTWTANERLSESFNPHLGWPQQNKMGDYFDMFSDENGAHLAWAATFNGEQDVYYSLIVPSYVRINENQQGTNVYALKSYPNPFRSKATISFELKEKDFITLKVYDIKGAEVATLVNGLREAGVYRESFEPSGREGGVYYYRLQTSQSSQQQRIILLR
jgi:hypothetical protein